MMRLPAAVSTVLSLCLLTSLCRAGKCQSHKWKLDHKRGLSDISNTQDTWEWEWVGGDIDDIDPQPGDITCRYTLETGDSVRDDTCSILAGWDRIGVTEFLTLNPELGGDCANLKPYTSYCVRGCKSSPPILKKP
jgi:hypothetical protein